MSNTPNSGERGRFSAPRKAAVLRLLRGESLELLGRELGVTAATLAGWRDDFLACGQAALKSRPADDRDEERATASRRWSRSARASVSASVASTRASWSARRSATTMAAPT